MRSRFIALTIIAISHIAVAPNLRAQAPDSAQSHFWDAAMKGDTVVMAQALKQGAVIDSLDTRTSRNGRRALNWAAWFNQPSAIRFLVAHGANINLTNITGFTPLHHAAENGSLEAARVLLELGAKTSVYNAQGLSPLDVANERSQLEIVALFNAVKH